MCPSELTPAYPIHQAYQQPALTRRFLGRAGRKASPGITPPNRCSCNRTAKGDYHWFAGWPAEYRMAGCGWLMWEAGRVNRPRSSTTPR